jgi:hypothetical protein
MIHTHAFRYTALKKDHVSITNSTTCGAGAPGKDGKPGPPGIRGKPGERGPRGERGFAAGATPRPILATVRLVPVARVIMRGFAELSTCKVTRVSGTNEQVRGWNGQASSITMSPGVYIQMDSLKENHNRNSPNCPYTAAYSGVQVDDDGRFRAVYRGECSTSENIVSLWSALVCTVQTSLRGVSGGSQCM